MTTSTVIPAKAGIQDAGMSSASMQQCSATLLDSRFRGNDG